MHTQRLNLRPFPALLALLCLLSSTDRAEYHKFNTAPNSDGIVQEVRWPYWAETTYNAIYSQTLVGSDGGRCYFYGGMPSDPNGKPPCSIIWSFWPPSGTAIPGAAVKPVWTAPNMFAPPHVGEGASGKAAGAWPLITTKRWYREVLRIWQPVDGTPHLGYIARWLRDPASGVWYHLATMEVPFAATGINALSGFQEDFVHRNRKPRRTDFRNVYYHKDGAWHKANQFTPSVRQKKEKGTARLIEGDTAAFFEVSMEPNYSGNLDNDAGRKSVTLTMAGQPPSPPIDPIVVKEYGAARADGQLLVHWQLPPTSSPQFAYTIEVFDNPEYQGKPALSVHDIAPETRQRLLDVTRIARPYVRLTITDVFGVAATPLRITPATATLRPASHVAGTVKGLAYRYYEKDSDFGVLPDFSRLTPVSEGAVNVPDLTIRHRRHHYAFLFTGYLRVPKDGIYTFTLHSCDGSRLSIDGTPVVDWDGRHSPGSLSGWIALEAGNHAVDLRYFFDRQNKSAGDLIDSLSLSWTMPGTTTSTPIPADAWNRLPADGEPRVVLSSPSNGASISGANVTFKAHITPAGKTVTKVRFYSGPTCWGEVDTPPYDLQAFVWDAADNPFRARVFYDVGHTIDSASNIVTTTNMPLAPWENLCMSEHTYPQGARILSGTYSLIGDGLHFLGRRVTGDCTLVAHVADMIASRAGPDGQRPNGSWRAGIIMRENATRTPGMPLGKRNTARFAAVFATVSNDTHFQNCTMANAGGAYWSRGLGGQRWLKLRRSGTTFTTYLSTDGADWMEVNSVQLPKIASNLYVGMFTYAASSQNPNVHWASFDNVSIVGDIPGPPGVTLAPQTATAYRGQTLAFTALPCGKPPFTYQWQYNGKILRGETGPTLTRNSLRLDDAGSYTVILHNAGGSARATANLTVLTPSPAIAAVLARQPMAYWRLNDVGPIAKDVIGLHNGTAQGGVLFGVRGVGSPFNGFTKNNRAARFNGTDSAIAIPPFNLKTANLTITGWVKRAGSQPDYAGLVFSRLGNGRGLGIMVVDNALRFSWDDDGSEYTWNSGLSLPEGQWTFFALTIDPTQANLYKAVNGTLTSARRIGANQPKTLDAGFLLGLDPSSASRRFKGDIDEVSIYQRTLTRQEVQHILAGL